MSDLGGRGVSDDKRVIENERGHWSCRGLCVSMLDAYGTGASLDNMTEKKKVSLGRNTGRIIDM